MSLSCRACLFPKLPKEGKRLAPHLHKAIILHAFNLVCRRVLGSQAPATTEPIVAFRACALCPTLKLEGSRDSIGVVLSTKRAFWHR